MKKLTVILDPAHGANVSGKQSPNGKFKEYLWSRKVIRSLKAILEGRGYGVYVTVQDDLEPGLSARVNRANAIEGAYKIFFSLHVNASNSLEEWRDIKGGIEIWTSPGQTTSDKYADVIMNTLLDAYPDIPQRYDKSDGDLDKESKFTVLVNTTCPAVLLEMLFQDDPDDYAVLMDDAFTAGIAYTLANAFDGIEKLINHGN